MTKLSATSAAELKPGETLRDHVVAGLQLRARAGVKSWHVYYRDARGDQRKPKIGTFPLIGLEKAREIAKEWLRRVALGEDPSGEKQAARDAPRVAELALRYLEFKNARNKPSTMVDMTRHVHKHIIPELGHIRVSDVTSADVARVTDAVANRKHTDPDSPQGKRHADAPPALISANRVRETLRGMFNYASRPSVGWRSKETNPVTETVRNKERKRKVHMTETQFVDVGAALAELAGTYPRQCAALFCILLCGTRVSELARARRDQFDGEKIVLQEHKTDRTGDDREIFVPAQARRIIDKIPIEPGDPLIFGGVDRRSIGYVWEKARELAGCPDIQVRDFRRTFASIALSRGVKLDQIGELFGHKSTQTTRGYAWLTDQTARSVTQGTADVMDRLMIEGKQ